MTVESRIVDLATGISAYIRDTILPRLLPAGGTTGQVVVRKPGGLAGWDDPPAGGGGATTLTDPILTYTSGRLTSVSYSDGTVKTLSYTAGVLTRLDSAKGGTIVRKDLIYNLDGTLASIAQSTL